MKIVINRCFGGFSLSKEAEALYLQKSGREGDSDFYDRDIPRDDKHLVEVVETLKDQASGFLAKLKVVDIPTFTDWEIAECNGLEHIAEVHQTWS